MTHQRLQLTSQGRLQASGGPSGGGHEAANLSLTGVAYTGVEIRQPWSSVPLVVDLAGMNIRQPVSLRVDHGISIDATAGQGTARVDSGQLLVEGQIVPGSQAVDRVIELARGGIALEMSIGADVLQLQRLSETETAIINGRTFVGPLDVVTRSELLEISVVALGADRSTSVRIEGSATMPEITPVTTVDPLQASREAAAAELERQANIGRICASHPSIGAQAIREGWDVNRAELEVLRASRPTVGAPQAGGRPAGPNSTTDLITAALMCRVGLERVALADYGERTLEMSRALQRMPLPELMAYSLTHAGVDTGAMPRHQVIKAAISTGSMPQALSNVANKSLMAAYNAAPAAWRSFAVQKVANDFKEQLAVKGDFMGDLEPVPDGGQVPHANYNESYYKYSVEQYAKQISIGRKALVNDDVGVFIDVIPAMGRAAARTLSDLVARIMLANTGNFWSAGNGNLLTGMTSIMGAAGLERAIRTLRQRKDKEGSLLDLQPAVLLVPPELEQTTRAILMSSEIQPAVGEPIGNVYQNIAALAVDPRLSDAKFTNNSATAWWLFATGSESVIVAFLNGASAPFFETFDINDNPNELSMTWRCVHDFGAALGDNLTSIKCAGA